MKISQRAKDVSPSLTLELTAKAKKMKEEGSDVVSFGAGEPDFNTPEYVREGAKEALDKGMTKYTPASGTVALKTAICKKMQKDNNLTYSAQDVVVSNGAKHALHNAIQAVVEEGDEVIIPAPFWLTYPELVKLAGGKPVYVYTSESNGFKLTAEQLEKAITDKTKAIILNNPNNPTGAVYTKDEIYALAKVIEKTDICVISDEIYEVLNYTGEPVVSIATYSEKLKEQTIIINGVSKSYTDLSWDFIKFIITEEGQEAAGETGLNIPVLKKLYDAESNGGKEPAWRKVVSLGSMDNDAWVAGNELSQDTYNIFKADKRNAFRNVVRTFYTNLIKTNYNDGDLATLITKTEQSYSLQKPTNNLR